MKIDVNKIPAQGLSQQEDIDPKELDISTQEITFKSPVHVDIFARRITNAVHIDADITADIYIVCGRCLESFRAVLDRKFKLNFMLEKNQQFIDLDPDIREEIILNYPIKLVCSPDCKGLCHKCGVNLNVGKCNC